MAESVHVTFFHGLANKPASEQLQRIWLDALAAPVADDAGFDLGAVGVTASFVYWADLFYDTPLDAAGYESRTDELAASAPVEPALGADAWSAAMRAKFVDPEVATGAASPAEPLADGFERIPIPWAIKRRVMQHFVREAHDYLFNVDQVRDRIRTRALDDFARTGNARRQVWVGHSQGSIIAYDLLTAVPDGKAIDGLLTLGSPLGVDEIQDRLTWSRNNGFPARLHGAWVNVYDPYDPVSRPDPCLSNDFRRAGERAVIDVREPNWGRWRHAATKYLKGPQLRRHLRRLCDRVDA